MRTDSLQSKTAYSAQSSNTSVFQGHLPTSAGQASRAVLRPTHSQWSPWLPTQKEGSLRTEPFPSRASKPILLLVPAHQHTLPQASDGQPGGFVARDRGIDDVRGQKGEVEELGDVGAV